ncbi:ABC transporter ATP-binding protein [Streptomyces sp. WAC05374]|uniref:ABC transporter ATP-binding protein n=1 Tax=Streptomyces sp. WAC05374 TaxID=2487420 RepID=UPI000F85FEC9|nr:ABC transporter ATP-binding protein [Streptomyces sp. WAC05374]RST12901.1 ABC transporter ATP-binding protein [Streptomyces sp. WAC05374]TDF42615.1 ABC transporter ATP-binding protein [Streptomyces sp. WAC05374]TDF51175.1 ABC transporter ATP-binding protein [Streptomyces sp. WAC05374]TDF52488.1 ABC transporter ATP-binding protein [Streptomyces sp. WAC05374]
MSRAALPVADTAEVRRHARALARRHSGDLGVLLALHGLAAACGLVAPWLIGRLIDEVVGGTTAGTVDLLALGLLASLVAQAALTYGAVQRSCRFGEKITAEVREDFVDRVVDLPLSTVEDAEPGDLITRASRDTDALTNTVRYAAPETLIASLTCLFTFGALLLTGPLTALPSLLVIPPLWIGTRWYLRRSGTAYRRRGASYVALGDSLAETVPGARTAEAFGLQRWRRRALDRDLGTAYRAERHTMWLRSSWYLLVELSYAVPLVATLAIGGLLHTQGLASLGQVVAATLYVRQLIFPLDDVLSWMDELQIGSASLARVLGVSKLPADREPTGARPTGQDLTARAVTYSYVPERPVLHGVDLDLAPGERLAVVGPSGSGKSTLGKLLAGIYHPGSGTVRLGGVPLVDLSTRDLRGRIALVTQEHHIFRGTLRENLTLARPAADDTEVRRALDVVGAGDWAAALPHGLDTPVGSTGHDLTAAQAQQVALARLLLADPHTLVLDEATALLDPATARHTERAMAAVLSDRSVIAIAHRLHTAEDADRIAVVENGRITELGSHHELLAAGGAYAALWRAWHGE